MREHHYWVYMLTGTSRRAMYTGVTNDLARRLREHRAGIGSAFTTKYKLHRLIYFEAFSQVHAAIAREKQIKASSRAAKEKLVHSFNPDWHDLSQDWNKLHSYRTIPDPSTVQRF